jgi:hypothetical protein
VIRLTAIMSGGQTGADRGALDAAIQLGLGWGGWAPKGWRAEDGVIPEIYREHMRESSWADYKLRTRLNIQDTDGTLIVSFGPLSGGSEYTAQHAKHQRKPCKHLQLPAQERTRIPDAVRVAILTWIEDNRISTLNVAGPRESKEPGIQLAVRDALVWVLEDEVVEPAVVNAVRFDLIAGRILTPDETFAYLAAQPRWVEVQLGVQRWSVREDEVEAVIAQTGARRR